MYSLIICPEKFKGNIRSPGVFRRRDEIDVISSVSGGSYTAAYYGLFGKRIFSEFEPGFLRINVQGELFSHLYNPGNLLSLARSDYNQGDLIASWLGENVFQNKTFREMPPGKLPYVIINTSDLNTG